MSDLLNSASLVMIPSGYKEDIVYSEIPIDGSGDLQLTRASNGTRVNSAGLVEVCPWNLVEYSEDMNSQPQNIDVTVNTTATTSPIGTNNGNKVSETATTNAHVVRTDKATPNGYDIVSIYAKAAERTFIQIQSWADPSSYVNFNLSTGVVSAYSVATIYGIESVGNGWYRCYANVQASGSGVVGVGIITSGTAGWAQSYLGDTSKGVYMWGLQVNIGSTDKPYFPTTDRLNVPRLTYQNGGGGCPSLLLEKQSTNLVVQSNDMTTWANGGGTMTKNATTSPDGTNNALSYDNSGDCSTFAGASNGVHSWSVYVKQGTSPTASIDMSDGATGDVITTFTFATKTFSGTSAGGSWTSPSTSYIECGNGWFRITLIATKNAGISIGHKIIASGSGYTYVYGAQLEASSYPTSYIPTTSSSATRVADACFKTGISSLIGQTEGAALLDFQFNGVNDAIILDIAASGLSPQNRIILYQPNSTAVQFIVLYNDTNPVSIASSSYAVGQRLKVAIAYKENDFAFYINGVQIGIDSSGSVPATSRIDIGNRQDGAYPASITVNEFYLSKTRLTNAELAQLTA